MPVLGYVPRPALETMFLFRPGFADDGGMVGRISRRVSEHEHRDIVDHEPPSGHREPRV